jgi:hypothetical protein
VSRGGVDEELPLGRADGAAVERELDHGAIVTGGRASLNTGVRH